MQALKEASTRTKKGLEKT